MSDVFKRLAKKLDTLPQGFPATESGVELKILRKIFSPEDAEMTLRMRPLPETAEGVAKRLGRPVEEMRTTLDGMANRGQIAAMQWRGERRYSLAPFVVTLGTMGAARGVAKWVSGETTIEPPREAVAPLADLLVKQWLAPGLLLALALSFAAAFLLKRTVFGVHTLAVGSSEPTARLCGVPVERTKLLVYGLGGLMAGLAGVLQMGRVGVGDPTASAGAELNVIAAVVLGGASLAGGSGSVSGTLVGALLMSTLANGCNLLGWPPYVQQILTGVIIIAAVALDRWRQARG